MANPLKCIFINVNSIVSKYKRHYLNLFLTEHSPDVLLLAEHRLSSRHRLDIKGYTIYRQDRQNGRGGGTTVLVRDTLVCDEVKLDTGPIENTAVRIKRSVNNDVIVIAMYLEPSIYFEVEFLDSLQVLVGSYSMIIGADLNARHPYWGDPYTNGQSGYLYQTDRRTNKNKCRYIILH